MSIELSHDGRLDAFFKETRFDTFGRSWREQRLQESCTTLKFTLSDLLIHISLLFAVPFYPYYTLKSSEEMAGSISDERHTRVSKPVFSVSVIFSCIFRSF